MSADPPRDPSEDEIHEAGPEPSKEASSPLYATANPTPADDEGAPDEEVDGEG